MNDTANSTVSVDVSLNGSSTVSPTRSSVELFQENFSLVFIPIIVIIGWTGNSLTLLTMRQKAFRNQSTALCISALTILDSLYLAVVLYPRWFDLALGYSVPSDCRVISALSVTLSMSRMWTVVTMNIDRCWKLFCPAEPAKVGIRRAMVIIASTIVILFGLCSHYLYGRQPITCAYKPDYDFFYNRVWPIINMTVYCLLPSLLIIIANTVLIVKTRHQTAILNNGGLQLAFKQRIKRERKMNIVLLTVSATIVLLTAPLTIFNFLPKYVPSIKLKNSEYNAIQYILIQILSTASAINFFLYILTSSTFRRELLKAFGCWQWFKRGRHRSSMNAVYSVSQTMSKAS